MQSIQFMGLVAVSDPLLKAQQMKIFVNFCNEENKIWNKRTVWQGARRNGEWGKGRQHLSMEEGVRNEANFLSETPLRIHQGQNWKSGQKRLGTSLLNLDAKNEPSFNR